MRRTLFVGVYGVCALLAREFLILHRGGEIFAWGVANFVVVENVEGKSGAMMRMKMCIGNCENVKG